MPDSIMYQEDCFVVLEPDQPEQFLTAEELLQKLKKILQDYQDQLPRELEKLSSLEEQAQYLRDNYCDFDLEPGSYLQWYIVRLEK